MTEIWTDTHYKLAASDALYIAKHKRENSAFLARPGEAKKTPGFYIHFTSAHLEVLEQLVEVLRDIKQRENQGARSHSSNNSSEITDPKGQEK